MLLILILIIGQQNFENFDILNQIEIEIKDNQISNLLKNINRDFIDLCLLDYVSAAILKTKQIKFYCLLRTGK